MSTRYSVGDRIKAQDIVGTWHEGVVQGWSDGWLILSDGNGTKDKIRERTLVSVLFPLKA